MLKNTQVLKDKLQKLRKEGKPFSPGGLGVGQEFVSVIKTDGQKPLTKHLLKEASGPNAQLGSK